MRGSTYLIVDTVAGANAARRRLIEILNFPPTLAFAKSAPKTPSMSAIAAQLPANVKLQTVTNNYVAWNGGQLILRLAHMYAVGEHPTLSEPATFSLASVFAKAGLKLTAVSETTVTGNRSPSAAEPFAGRPLSSSGDSLQSARWPAGRMTPSPMARQPGEGCLGGEEEDVADGRRVRERQRRRGTVGRGLAPLATHARPPTRTHPRQPPTRTA
jgi:hypothetical protein